MEYLFLCAEGQCRSKTAADVAERIAKSRGLEIHISYGGVNKLVQLPRSFRDLLQNQDKIFVMELYIKTMIENYGAEPEKISCLDILDKYDYNAPKLVRQLENKLSLLMTQ